MRLSIVIPLYKSQAYTHKLIESLALCSPNVETVWVSDGDGAYDVPGKFVQLPENKGFAAACNAGVAACDPQTEAICLLNADTWVSAGWLDPLVKALESDPKIAIVAPCILNPDGSINSLGSKWDDREGVWHHVGGGQRDHPDLHRGMIVERDMVTFACALIRRLAWEEFGGLDEGFKVGYWEDSDLCMKVKERGYRIIVEPRSRIYHIGNSSGLGYGPAWWENRIRYHARWVDSGRQFRSTDAGEPLYVHRLGSLGDVLMATSLIRRIRLTRPKDHIRLATWCDSVVENNPDINTLHSKYDPVPQEARVADLNWGYERRPMMPVMMAYAEAANMPQLNRLELLDLSRPKVYPSLEERKWALSVIPHGQPWVAIHAGAANWACKNWPWNCWQEVLAALRAKRVKILSIWPKGEAPHGDFDFIPRAENTEVTKAAALIERCAAFIGLESLPAHLAQAMKVPSVILFGPTEPMNYLHAYPRRGVVEVVRAEGGCLGCVSRRPREQKEVICDKMRNGFAPCMSSIMPSVVLEAVLPTALEPKWRLGEAGRVALKHCGGRGMTIQSGYWPFVPESILVDSERHCITDYVHEPNTPFTLIPDAWLDYIFCDDLDRVGDLESAFTEWSRMLRAGGKIVLIEESGQWHMLPTLLKPLGTVDQVLYDDYRLVVMKKCLSV